jgi:hypothetical protein
MAGSLLVASVGCNTRTDSRGEDHLSTAN